MNAETVTTDPKLLPARIQEFNQITAVIFATLYKHFPEPITIENRGLARDLGFSVMDPLPSGQIFQEVLGHTLNWLIEEGFINLNGDTRRCILTTKALTVMNLVPPNLDQSLGTQLVKATEKGASESGKSEMAGLMGTFFGNFVGSAAKTIFGS